MKGRRGEGETGRLGESVIYMVKDKSRSEDIAYYGISSWDSFRTFR